MGDFSKLMEDAFTQLGHHDHDMSRDRPYAGQPHTATGMRGSTEIKGVTFRDMHDAFIRAIFLSAYDVVPHLYEEALKGTEAVLCVNDLYGWDLNRLDPLAVSQNLSCEIEKLMGIYPNVPRLEKAD